MKKKILRITTVSGSIRGLLRGQLKFMSQYYEVVGVSSFNKVFLKDIEKNEGIRMVPINMTRQITPIRDIVALVQLYNLFKKEKPFAVHTHTPKAGTLGMIAAKLANVPNRLHTVAGLPLLESKGFKRKLLNFVEKLTYRCATKVYPNSKGLEQIILSQRFCSANKLMVIAKGSSNGIDTAYFDPKLISIDSKTILRETLNISPDDFVFIFIGRLVSDKGINELVSAFERLSKEQNNVKLILVGTFEDILDPLKDDTKRLIKENNKILEVGWQDDVRPYLAIANILVFPSYREGFPNVVMQAGAMGLYSIVTNINGCNEIILENENGTIIPVKDENYLLDKMMLASTGKIKFNQKACRDLIKSRYERHIVWDALLKEYKTLEKLN